MKEISRDKKRMGDRQEAEKKRQLDKNAKVETLRNQAAATPVLDGEDMEESAVVTDGVSDGITAGTPQRKAEGATAVGNATEALRQMEAELEKKNKKELMIKHNFRDTSNQWSHRRCKPKGCVKRRQ